MEYEPVHLLARRSAGALLAAGDVHRLPAALVLGAKDRPGAKRVAAVQGNGVIQDVQDAQGLCHGEGFGLRGGESAAQGAPGGVARV